MKLSNIAISVFIMVISFGLIYSTFFQAENKKIVREAYEQICCNNVSMITPFTINNGEGAIASLQKNTNNVIFIVTGKWVLSSSIFSSNATNINKNITNYNQPLNKIEFSAKINLVDEKGGVENDYKIYNFKLINATRIENTSTSDILFQINGTASIKTPSGNIDGANIILQIWDQKGKGFGKDRAFSMFIDKESMKKLNLINIPIYGNVKKFSTNLPY